MSVSKEIHYLINADLQQVNLFKLIFIESFENPGGFTSGGSFSGGQTTATFINAVGQIGNQALSLFASSYLIQSVTIPSPVTLEYDESETKYVKSLKRPENVTLSFLETEEAIAWRFLQNWRKEIVQVAPVSLTEGLLNAVGQGTEPVKYMFADNQEATKKTGILLPMGSGRRRIGKFPRIVMHGMRYASNSELAFSYTESGNLVITAEFNVTEIGAPVIF